MKAAMHLNSGLCDLGQLPSSSKGFTALSEDGVTGTPAPKRVGGTDAYEATCPISGHCGFSPKTVIAVAIVTVEMM